MIVSLFFWPAVALSVLVAVAGVILRKSTLLLVAAAFVLPVGLYLLAALAIRWLNGLPGRTTSISLIVGNVWFFWDLTPGVC